jgi:hypothetical protein
MVVLEFIKDNWLAFGGGLGAVLITLLIPALRSVAFKGIQLAVMQIGKAFMAMLTKEFFVKALIWSLEQLAKMTKGTFDDELVAKLKKQLEDEAKE